jgi:hypothetical protein
MTKIRNLFLVLVIAYWNLRFICNLRLFNNSVFAFFKLFLIWIPAFAGMTGDRALSSFPRKRESRD